MPASQFHFRRNIYLKSYWQDALKQKEKSLHATVSRPYEDFAGAGQMITLSQPIVKDQVLVGVISIDVLLSRLEQLLRESTPGIGTLFLVNQHQQILASSNQEVDFAPKPSTAQDGYHWQQGAFQFQYAIPDTELTLLHRIPCPPCCGPCSASPPRP